MFWMLVQIQPGLVVVKNCHLLTAWSQSVDMHPSYKSHSCPLWAPCQQRRGCWRSCLFFQAHWKRESFPSMLSLKTYQASHIVWPRHATSTLADELVSQLASLPHLSYLTRDLQSNFTQWCLKIKCGDSYLLWGGPDVRFEESSPNAYRNGTAVSLCYQGWRKRLMRLTGWEMSCLPSHLHRLALPGQQQGRCVKYANSSSQSQDGFFSSALSVMEQTEPKCAHDFILSRCLRHQPTYQLLRSQVTHIPVDRIQAIEQT